MVWLNSETYLPYVRTDSSICSASSRGGVTIRARGERCLRLSWLPLSPLRIGRTKAAVLPVPVCAHPMTSRPVVATGMACAWIGVGEVYPVSWMPRKTFSESPRLVKLMKIPEGRTYGAGVRSEEHTSEL